MGKRNKEQQKNENENEHGCPYSGCLRGANTKNEIESHILRHHDITDPTKEKIKKQTNKKQQIETKKEEKKISNEMAQITQIWNEANESQIDRINQRDLVKHFVASMFGGDLQKFDQTTKRLQKRYKALSQSDELNEEQEDEQNNNDVIDNDDDGPRSMWH